MDLSELYRDIVETSPDGIWVIDLDGRTLYANPEIARLHRDRRDEGLAALTVFDTLDEDGRAQFARAPGRRPRGPAATSSRCRGAVGAQRRHDAVDALQRDRAARRRGPAAGPAAPLLRQHRAARADRVAAGQRGRARGPGRPEQPHAGGRQRRQRGDHAGRRAACTPGPWCCCTTTGSERGPSCRSRTAAAGSSRSTRPPTTRRGRRRPAGRRGARPGPARPRRARAGLGRARAHHRVPGPARRRGLRRRRDHLRSPAVPLRADRDHGRPGRRAAGPGRRARARPGRAGPGPRRGDGGLAAEVGVPGHDEPRDPHAAQRRDRPQRPAAPHLARPRAAPAGVRCPGRPAGRCSGSSTTSSTSPRSRPAGWSSSGSTSTSGRCSSRCRGHARRAGPREAAGPRRGVSPGRPGRARPATRRGSRRCHQPGLQRREVHRARRGRRPGHRRARRRPGAAPRRGGATPASACRGPSATAALRPFTQADSSTTRHLRRHRARPGHLERARRGDGRHPEYSANPGGGSVFTFTVVLDPGVEPAAADPDAMVQPRAEQSGKGWILVVEDNPVNQLVATGLLAALGYTADTADDGIAAIEAARDGGFDAILMDVQMPHMDGYTATRHIRGTRDRPAPADHRDDRGRRRRRTRALPGGRHGRLPHQAGRRRPARRDARAVAGAQSVGTPTGWTWTGSRSCASSTTPATSRRTSTARSGTSSRGADGADRLMETAAAAGDDGQLRAVAHRLAGSALNLGAVALGEGARELEEHVMNGSLADAVAALPRLAEQTGGRPGGAARLPARAVPGSGLSSSRPRRPRRAGPRGGPRPPGRGSA